MSKLILILIVTLVTFFYGQDAKESNLDSTAINSLTTILKDSNKEDELVDFYIPIIDQNNVSYNNEFGYASLKTK
ncbi:hypothetical protein [uncultured Aquimarina sp.]|uniref:hypothetical protein n=1 Tax=uncultured Aquimarina sp. TaxID=575652 RepID=UPI002610D6EC|nr:hypothetical protein [uncultured Aquimarina sp.]